ncbi:MAG: hypothetical protein QOH32_3372 [Bradyrhizobium sp.]|jgi:hypothetical protein|nr:hypothetical protein [Bradyrhizobium sp.]
MGNVDIGDVSGSSELGDLFNIKPEDNRVEGVRTAGDVIRVCLAGSNSRTTDYLGIKTFWVTYECAGGRSFTRTGFGHYFPAIVVDPVR